MRQGRWHYLGVYDEMDSCINGCSFCVTQARKVRWNKIPPILDIYFTSIVFLYPSLVDIFKLYLFSTPTTEMPSQNPLERYQAPPSSFESLFIVCKYPHTSHYYHTLRTHTLDYCGHWCPFFHLLSLHSLMTLPFYLLVEWETVATTSELLSFLPLTRRYSSYDPKLS